MKTILLGLITSFFLSVSIQAQSIAGSWKLTSIVVEGDMVYVISNPIILNMDENGKFSGNGGCNDFVGLYSFKDPQKSFRKPQKIKFSDLIFCSAKKDCARASGTEDAFFQSLKQAATVAFEEDKLVIKSKPSFVKTPGLNINIQNTMTFVRETKSN